MRSSLVILIVTLLVAPSAQAMPAAERVQRAIEYMRDKTSYSVAEMTVHRPEWERRSTLEAWTEGLEHSLVRFIAPVKDAGNASLTLGNEMWTFNPKTNRVLKIPPSMKTQNWMGSDFSYEDLSKGDDIIEEYTHRDAGRGEVNGIPVTVVESIPKENAPVVWGKEVLKIADDNIVHEHEFIDQAGVLVKRLVTREVKEIGGKRYPTIMRMESLEKPGEWTEFHTTKAEFGIRIAPSLFTQSNLSSPRARGE